MDALDTEVKKFEVSLLSWLFTWKMYCTSSPLILLSTSNLSTNPFLTVSSRTSFFIVSSPLSYISSNNSPTISLPYVKLDPPHQKKATYFSTSYLPRDLERLWDVSWLPGTTLNHYSSTITQKPFTYATL